MTSEAERNRLAFVLGAVYDDHITDATVGKQAFIEQYMKKAARKHPTHRLVDVCVDLYYASPHRAKWYVEKGFADWLVAEDPMLNFGEIEGKYSDVDRYFSDCCDIVDDYFLIEPHDNVKPEDLPEELESSYEKYSNSTRCAPCSQYFKRSELLAVTEEGDEESHPECTKCVIDAFRLTPISKLELLSEEAHDDHDYKSCEVCALVISWPHKGLRDVQCDYCSEMFYARDFVLFFTGPGSIPDKYCVDCAKEEKCCEDDDSSNHFCSYDVRPVPNGRFVDHTQCGGFYCAVCDFVKEWHSRHANCEHANKESPMKRLRKE